MEQLNYDYLAGLVDGEGSFVIVASIRRKPSLRNPNHFSIFFYKWLSIHLSYGAGREALEAIQLFLKQDGIVSTIAKERIPTYEHNGVKKKGGPAFKLIIRQTDSLLTICDKLNGKVHLKQPELETFSMVMRMLKDKHNWSRSPDPTVKRKHIRATLATPKPDLRRQEWYRVVAIVWDSVRLAHPRKGTTPSSMEAKLLKYYE